VILEDPFEELQVASLEVGEAELLELLEVGADARRSP